MIRFSTMTDTDLNHTDSNRLEATRDVLVHLTH